MHPSLLKQFSNLPPLQPNTFNRGLINQQSHLPSLQLNASSIGLTQQHSHLPSLQGSTSHIGLTQQHSHLPSVHANTSSHRGSAHQHTHLSPLQPNTSNRGLTHQHAQYTALGTLQTSADQLLVDQITLTKRHKSEILEKMAAEDYKPAVYAKAVQYKNQHSYKEKNGNEYKEIGLLANTDELRHHLGLGPYFYVQFIRRLCWLLLVMTLVQIITIYINWKGVGLGNYPVSFFGYFIKASLGNYSGSVLTSNSDGYFMALTPAFNYAAIFVFYIIWKVHYFRTIAAQEEDKKDATPQQFCLEIKGLPAEQFVDQEQLKRFFKIFWDIYDVSVVRNYQNKLTFFQELEQKEMEIKEQELELKLDRTDKKAKKLYRTKLEKQLLEQQLNSMKVEPTTVSVFVQFQKEKQKNQCFSYFKDHYLLDICSHSCARCFCCCCIPKPGQKAVFKHHTLILEPERPPAPSDINWFRFQVSSCGRILRYLLAFTVVLAFLLLSTTILGLCGIYISAHSNDCEGVDTNSYTAASATATNDQRIMRCYCNANLVSSFTDSTIKTACADYLRDIYVQQVIQYVVLLTSIVTNALFGIVVNKLVICMKPYHNASALFIKTSIMTVFMVINSIFVPVLIYADIFGFLPTNYVSFLTIISTDIKNFLKVDNISLYPTFTNIWYRNVAPLFVNFVIVNMATTWGVFILNKCCCFKTFRLERDEGKILQKTMNRKMTDFQLDVATEASNIYLIFIIAGLFCAGIPTLLPLAFLNILSRYITNRSLLQFNSSKVPGLGQYFSLMSVHIFPIMLILFPLVGEWMVASSAYIYPNGLPADLSFHFLQGGSVILDKQAFLPFYLVISLLALLQLVIYNTIVRFGSCISRVCCQKKEENYFSDKFSNYMNNKNVLSSYNIKDNDELKNVVLHLEKYLVDHSK